MKSKLQENPPEAPPVPVYIASTVNQNHEIDFVDLWRVIAKRKAIILASWLLAVMLAFAYLFFAEPMYRANAYLLPPQYQKIQGLLIGYRGMKGVGTKQYTPESIYNAFLYNLRSRGMRREFFDDHELIKHYAPGKATNDVNVDRVFEKLFNERLRVQNDTENPLSVMASFSDSDPILAAQWLNQMIDFANKRTIRQMFINVSSVIQSEIGKIHFDLDSKLKFAERRKLDTIVKLKEALRVATALGIEDATTFDAAATKNQSGLVVNTAEVPLYKRGVKALEAEILVLEMRKSDEPFIDKYRDLQERRAFLEGISIDIDTLSAVTYDAVAKTPYRAERPRKLLLILRATALGIIIGIFLVFVAEYRSKLYGEHEKAKA